MQRFLTLLITLGIIYACERSQSGNDQDTDRERLAEMRQEIIDKIDAIPCDNDEDWRPQALGSKACGGPQSYIPYPKASDESGELLAFILEYTRLEANYNEKYGVISDCMSVISPAGIRCIDGKPEFVEMASSSPVGTD